MLSIDVLKNASSSIVSSFDSFENPTRSSLSQTRKALFPIIRTSSGILMIEIDALKNASFPIV